MKAVVSELNVFPLKSARGTALGEAELTANGLRHDREFMLARPAGQHLSQREVPRLALVRPSYDGVKLTVHGPDSMAPLLHTAADGPARDVTVHRRPCQGVDQGDEAAEWFSGALGTSCRLMRFTGTRPSRRGGGTVAFADGYPLMVLSRESLDDLNRRLPEPLPMNRFRPSIVIEGLGPYGEDAVSSLRIGGAQIDLIKPCDRCVITTINQDTAARKSEPLRTLASYRTQVLDDERGIMFGMLAIPRALGRITLGDTVTAS